MEGKGKQQRLLLHEGGELGAENDATNRRVPLLCGGVGAGEEERGGHELDDVAGRRVVEEDLTLRESAWEEWREPYLLWMRFSSCSVRQQSRSMPRMHIWTFLLPHISRSVYSSVCLDWWQKEEKWFSTNRSGTSQICASCNTYGKPATPAVPAPETPCS